MAQLHVTYDAAGKIARAHPEPRTYAIRSRSRDHTYTMVWVDGTGWDHQAGDYCEARQKQLYCWHRTETQRLWLDEAPKLAPGEIPRLLRTFNNGGFDLDREFDALEMERAYARDRDEA